MPEHTAAANPAWNRSDKAIAWALVLIFCIVGLLTIDDYGLTFDETWHLFTADRYFRFWTTFDRTLLDFSQPHPTDEQPASHPVFERRNNEPRPAVANTLYGLSGWLFADKLGWLDPVDAYHLPVILMAGGTLAVVYGMGRAAIGQPAAFFATLALGLSPRFLAHAHFNIKDTPKTFFFALTIWAFWKASVRRDWRWMMGSAVFFGLAFGTRVNAVLIPVIVVPWLAVLLLSREGRRSPRPRGWWAALLAYPIVAGVTWVVTWPPMLVAPLDTVKGFIHHWLFLGFGAYCLDTWSPYGPLYIAITTPLVVLLPALIGILTAVRETGRDPQRTGLLLLLWAGVPVLRTALPRATNYDGIRQFMEFLPALCLLAGLGAQRMVEALKASLRHPIPRWATSCALGLAFLPILIKVIQIHPYELTYFNPLIGGLAGAQRLNIPDATDYWGSTHRQGLAWLNANAEPGAQLYISDGNTNMVVPVCHIWLRADITLLTPETLDRAAPDALYVAHVTRPRWYDAINLYCEENLEPVYSIRVDDTPIYNIFHLEAGQWLQEGG